MRRGNTHDDTKRVALRAYWVYGYEIVDIADILDLGISTVRYIIRDTNPSSLDHPIRQKPNANHPKLYQR